MAPKNFLHLSRRERQIMDIIFRLGHASVSDVMENLSDPPSYSAVRAMLRVLEEKGHLEHEQDGPRYIYKATVEKERASRSALNHLVKTFFGGSAQKAFAALLDASRDDLSQDDLERLSSMIEETRSEGR